MAINVSPHALAATVVGLAKAAVMHHTVIVQIIGESVGKGSMSLETAAAIRKVLHQAGEALEHVVSQLEDPP